MRVLVHLYARAIEPGSLSAPSQPPARAVPSQQIALFFLVFFD
jgi:hypothetical protein